MSKKISFLSLDEVVSSSIMNTQPMAPSSKYIPNWYKDSSPFADEQKTKATYKKCISFLDSLTSGYMVSTICDIYVEHLPNGQVEFKQSYDAFKSVTIRGFESVEGLAHAQGWSPQIFAWVFPYGIKTPKGYSSLITHPMNRDDLPFRTTSGIVDSDVYFSSGAVPFSLKDDFEGLIPVGTPIAQIIPFKREDWTSETIKGDPEQQAASNGLLRKRFSGVYKDLFWQNKKYR